MSAIVFQTEISPSEEPAVEDTAPAPAETECTDTSELPECNNDHAETPGEEGSCVSVPEMEEEEEVEKKKEDQRLPDTVTEIGTEEQQEEQDCCTDGGGGSGGGWTQEEGEEEEEEVENMCCDLAQDGEGVSTGSSVCCGDENAAG